MKILDWIRERNLIAIRSIARNQKLADDIATLCCLSNEDLALAKSEGLSYKQIGLLAYRLRCWQLGIDEVENIA